MQILNDMAEEGFEEILCLHDARSRLRGFLAIHDTSSGPAFGGIRRWRYRDDEHALRDVMDLARAMTHKLAMAGIAGGGGKVVLMDRPDLDEHRAYVHLGRVIENLAGRYFAGPDVGTSEDHLRAMRSTTRFVVEPDSPAHRDLGDVTARGVMHGMRACLEHVFESASFANRHIVIQGLGDVGYRLAVRLVNEGARLTIADIDEERVAAFRSQHDVHAVNPEQVYGLEADVFSPCAMGGVLHDVSINRLKARIVAGSANNVLAHEDHGWALLRRGIAYAPDLLINSGAVIQGARYHLHGTVDNEREIARIGDEVRWVLDESRTQAQPTNLLAEQEAARRVAEARRRGVPYFPKRARETEW